MTHFATADERDDAFFGEQLERFRAWAEPLRAAAPRGRSSTPPTAPRRCATRRSHFDLVRCGVALYGLDPFGEDPGRARPGARARAALATSPRSRTAAPGESAGYGRRFVAERADADRDASPIGYGDGVRRGLTNNAEVLIAGRRVPLVGTVSMDNITVDLGPDADGAGAGDEAVLIGAQGDERILAEEVARAARHDQLRGDLRDRARVPREHHRDGVPR